MQISRRTWNRYIGVLRQINDQAGAEMLAFLEANDWRADRITRQACIDFGYALATKYGEAAGAVACEMYDLIAQTAAGILPAAEPAATATYAETAKAVNGTMKTGNNEVIASSISRLVKMAGVDATMHNAIRDHAEWAWIPVGDTCAFCIALASRGWQKASKSALKGNHAEHIHANCDCTYAIRFDNSMNVEGYDPDLYLKMYEESDPGGSSKDKINAMRRTFYAMNKDSGILNLDSSVAEEFNVSRKIIKEFVPAKSIEEAEEFASKYTSGGSYSKVDYNGVDLNYANEFNRAMYDVLSEYEPEYKLRNIGPMNMRSKKFKGTTADAAYQWGSNDLFFNKSYFKTQKDFNKHFKQYNELLEQVLPNIDSLIEKSKTEGGYFSEKQLRYLEALRSTKRTNVSNVDPYKTMVHELGHYLDDTIFRDEFKKRNIDLKNSFENYSRKISAYATESMQEYIAESFLAYFTGDEKIVDPKFAEVFKRAKK